MSQRRTENRRAWRPPSRERWSAGDGEAMLDALAASGESDVVFGRRTGIAPHRIRYWRKKLAAGAPRGGDRAPTSTVTGFVPVRVVPDRPLQPVRATRQVEATLRGGTRLVFSGDWDSAQLRPWLAALEADDAQ